MKPLFKLVKKTKPEKVVEGDVSKVSAKKEGVEWKSELHTTFLMEGKPTTFELSLQSGSFIINLKRFLEESGLPQGYITCDGGLLSNVLCGFFLTKHKPMPTFAEALFLGENKVVSISGFFLRIPKFENGKSTSSVVPHLHITFQDRDGKWLGGHLIDAEWGRLKCSVVPLLGAVLRREADPNTGVMHIRSDEARDGKPKAGEVMIFAFAPREDFPAKLFRAISHHGVQKANVRFAVGTLWWTSLNDVEESSLIKPREGLELVFAQGELSCKDGDFSHEIDTHLIDRYGRFYRGRLIRGEVKDLIEGVIRFES